MRGAYHDIDHQHDFQLFLYVPREYQIEQRDLAGACEVLERWMSVRGEVAVNFDLVVEEVRIADGGVEEFGRRTVDVA